MKERAGKINYLVCPSCGERTLAGTKDSRPIVMDEFGDSAHAIKRRRKCLNCNVRATTIELTEEALHAISHRVTYTNKQVVGLARQIATLIEGIEP